MAILAILAASAHQTLADGPMQCAKRDLVVAKLATGYGETRRSIGLTADNSVMELFASDATGTWTIMKTLPNGMTCLVASGESFEQVAAPLPLPPTF